MGSTLADVAAHAGVSVQTVSNALNNPALLKQATLEREAQAREAAMIARQTSLEAKAKEREAELAAKQEAAEADAAKREAEWRQRDAEMKTQQAAMEAEIARRETEAKNREAELLKAVPAELIKIVFLCSHKVLTHPRFLLAQQRTDQSATPCGYFSKATHGVTLI